MSSATERLRIALRKMVKDDPDLTAEQKKDLLAKNSPAMAQFMNMFERSSRHIERGKREVFERTLLRKNNSRGKGKTVYRGVQYPVFISPEAYECIYRKVYGLPPPEKGCPEGYETTLNTLRDLHGLPPFNVPSSKGGRRVTRRRRREN